MKAPELIVLLREKLGLSARQLSLMLKYSESYVWMVQSGKRKPSLPMCKRLVQCCDKQLGKRFKLDDLLGD